MIDIFGTLGPACDNADILNKMFAEGMTGIRINLSHTMLSECRDSIHRIKEAAANRGIVPKILIDMQGPELRIGRFTGGVELVKCVTGQKHDQTGYHESTRFMVSGFSFIYQHNPLKTT